MSSCLQQKAITCPSLHRECFALGAPEATRKLNYQTKSIAWLCFVSIGALPSRSSPSLSFARKLPSAILGAAEHRGLSVEYACRRPDSGDGIALVRLRVRYTKAWSWLTVGKLEADDVSSRVQSDSFSSAVGLATLTGSHH